MIDESIIAATTPEQREAIQKEAISNTLDEVCQWLKLAGEDRVARGIRRAFDHWPNHFCRDFEDGVCECGRAF